MPRLISPSKSDLTIATFEELSSNAAQVQESLLASILRENASCEYLQQFNVDKEIDAHSFTQRVPLVTHADIQPFIHRIANGEKTSMLTGTPIKALCLSSGTTATKEKYLPYHEDLSSGTLEVARIASAFRDRVYPISKGARILEFLFCGKFETTSEGVRVATVSTHMIRSEVFRQRQTNNGFKPCSPHPVVLGPDCRQVMYCHLLCGLLFSQDVEAVSAPFAYTVVEALRTLETEWEFLCEDLRMGALHPSKVTDNTLRAAMGEILRPNPKLAEMLHVKCKCLAEHNAWSGVLQVVWPHCKYVLSIMTGAMEAYIEKLQQYAGRRIALVSADYAATEGWIGVNVEPRYSPSAVSFTVLPTLAFFEFIPLMRRSKSAGGCAGDSEVYEEGQPVRLTDVKAGQEYEIVMTTRWGLYRYRLGDIVRVTGFYNATPQLAYVCRKNVMLSINIDKNTEKDLKVVMSKAAKRLAEVSGNAMQLVDYTSYAERKQTPGHYVIFWEVQDVNIQQPSGEAPLHVHANIDPQRQQPQISGRESLVSKKQLQTWLAECATLMDHAFVEPGYVTSRKMNTIGALELRVVRPGTFSKLLDRFLSRGAAITQYKTPRCIVSPDALSILHESTDTTFLSTATF